MFDSHAHVADEAFAGEAEVVYARAGEAGVLGWIEIGTSVDNSARAISLAEKFEGVYATVGVHPNEIVGLDEIAWRNIEGLLDHSKVKAVGEVGLDFSRGGEVGVQLKALKRFIDVADNHALPVVFHVRSGETVDAHEALLTFLLSLTTCPGGVIHTYSGTLAQAKRYLDLGLHLSVSGVVTFKNAGDLLSVVREVPLDRLMIETDAPYLTPVPYRGQRNEPAYVRQVAEKIAEIKRVPFEEVDRVTTETTRRLFTL